jgi:hypothetical protein
MYYLPYDGVCRTAHESRSCLKGCKYGSACLPCIIHTANLFPDPLLTTSTPPPISALQGAQEAVTSLPVTQQPAAAAVPGGQQQEQQSTPDWQWWRETLKGGSKGSSSPSTTSLSQLADAAVELDDRPGVSMDRAPARRCFIQ